MVSISSAERQFIYDHLTADVRTLLLRTQSADVDLKKVAAQIVARQKARDKLPTWYANDALVFPPALSVEQASSEWAARYKASVISGQLLLDLTGGMGVDTWAFAQRVDRVIYVEQNPELAELADHNFPRLGTLNVAVRSGDGLAFVDSLAKPADWIYLDPHRRNEQGHKVVRLEDCEPDLSKPDLSKPDLLKTLVRKSSRILLKTSPLIDLDATIRQLSGHLDNPDETGYSVGAVHVVAVQGEVKEVLFEIGPESTAPENAAIMAVNLSPAGTQLLRFSKAEEQRASVSLGDPLKYVYEPNAAVLKAGAFRQVAVRFGLTKLAPNSHLYTSNERQPDFPGRIFVLEQIVKPDRKALQAVLPPMKANLTIRNFPQSVAELRKKLGLREGGSVYILATTLVNGDKRLLVTRKADASDG